MSPHCNTIHVLLSWTQTVQGNWLGFRNLLLDASLDKGIYTTYNMQYLNTHTARAVFCVQLSFTLMCLTVLRYSISPLVTAAISSTDSASTTQHVVLLHLYFWAFFSQNSEEIGETPCVCKTVFTSILLPGFNFDIPSFFICLYCFHPWSWIHGNC